MCDVPEGQGSAGKTMIKLGHIVYSNCFPVHAGILNGQVAAPFKIIEGIPSELNRYLAEGKVDVSPSSSIEYAVNRGKYLILPDLSITSRTKVMSLFALSTDSPSPAAAPYSAKAMIAKISAKR